MLTITAPSVVFGAISLIFLAYTNRYLALATVIRKLHGKWRETKNNALKSQISILRERVSLITGIQICGLIALTYAIISMCGLLFGYVGFATFAFVLSLAFMICFIVLGIIEVYKSAQALDIELDTWQDEY